MRPTRSIFFSLLAIPVASAQTELLQVTEYAPMLIGQDLAALSDVDGDGVRDFASSYQFGSSHGFHVYSGRNGGYLCGQLGVPGARIFPVGDFDGSGRAFLAASTPEQNVVSVFALPDLTVVFHVELFGAGDFGRSVADVGDVDHDGFHDIVIGVPLAQTTKVEAGVARMYSGKTGVLLRQWSGLEPSGHFGACVGAAGDLDADGYPDILISEPNTAHPVVRVYSGLSGVLLSQVTGQDFSQFGASLEGGFDLNGDGAPDYVIGAPKHDVGALLDAGRVVVVSGADGGALLSVLGTTKGGHLGQAVANAGDVDHDGIIDVVMSSPDHLLPLGVAKGAVRVISGATGGQVRAFFGPPGSVGFGANVAGLGDLTGDGHAEIAFTDAEGGGAVHVHSGAEYAASWGTYGAGTAGTIGVPSLVPQGVPEVCAGSWNLRMTSASPVATPALLVFGVSAIELPSHFGGSLLVAPVVTTPMVLPAGATNVPVALCDVTLAGVDVRLQLIHQDSGAAKGVAFSAGLRLSFGMSE